MLNFLFYFYADSAEDKKVESSNCEKGCPFSWFPICGSDGKTYENDCMLEIAHCKDNSVVLNYDGECRRKCLNFLHKMCRLHPRELSTHFSG